MPTETYAASLDPSQQLILEVEKYIEATRELNVAMMMISRLEQNKDPQAEVYHFLEGISRLPGISERIQKSWHAIRKQEELLSAGASAEADPISSFGPYSNQSSRSYEVWSRGDWLTEKALEALPELSATADRFFADLHLKLKIYAVYLVSNACPVKGRNGSFDTCTDPEGKRICCNLKSLISLMQERLEKQYKYKGEDLCTNEIDQKTGIMLELTADIDGLGLVDLNYVARELGGEDLYWAKKVKEDVVVASGEFVKAGGWDYLNTVKDSFFSGVSSTWDNFPRLADSCPRILQAMISPCPWHGWLNGDRRPAIMPLP